MLRWLFPGFNWAVVFFVFWGGWADADAPKIVPAETVEYASIVSSGSSVPLPSSTDESGIGSRFGDPGDRWTGGAMACSPHAKVDSKMHACAHRWYPCGTLLIVEYNGARNWCEVTDRGPYGANVFAADGKMVMNGGSPAWYVMVHQGDPPPDELCPDGGCKGRWRGVIDMSPAVSKGMGHPGMGHVRVWTLKRVVDYQKYLATKKPPASS